VSWTTGRQRKRREKAGRQEIFSSPVLKVPRQCPLVLLIGSDVTESKRRICTATHFTFVYEMFTGLPNKRRRITEKIIANGII
jgi:hypothetical protein